MVKLRSGGGVDDTETADLSSGEIVKEGKREKYRKKDSSSGEIVNKSRHEGCEEEDRVRNTCTDAWPRPVDRSKVKQFRSTFEGSAEEGRLRMLAEFVQCHCTSLQDVVILSNLPTPNWSHSSISIEFVQCHRTSLQDMVMLRGESGRRWPVKCSLVDAPGDTFRGAFTEGWKSFVEDNELQVGDTLIFNLLGEASFFIVRISAISPQSISPKDTHAVRFEESKPPADTESFLPEGEMVEPPQLETPHGQFATIMTPTSSLSSSYPYLMLPREFVHQHGSTLPRLVHLRGSRSAKSWPVKCTLNSVKTNGCFTRGWKNFVTNNALKKGDHLTFTLTEASHFAVTYH